MELAWENGDEFNGEHIGFSGIEHWPYVTLESPTQVVDTKVKELQAVVENLRKEQTELRNEIRKEHQEHTSLMTKFKTQIPALRRIDDFLEERILYYVIGDSTHYPKWGRLRIVDVNNAKGEAFYERDRKLLVLFGTKDGNVEWRLNAYSDGSGDGYQAIWPCTSLEEAQDTILRVTRLQIDSWTQTNTSESARTIINNCKVAGILAPQAMHDFVNKQKQRTAQAVIDDLEKRLAAQKALLEKE